MAWGFGGGRAKKGRGSVGSHMDKVGSCPFASTPGAGHLMEGSAGAVVGLLLERVREGWEDRMGAPGSSAAPWQRGQGGAGEGHNAQGAGAVSSGDASSSSFESGALPGDQGRPGKRERRGRSKGREGSKARHSSKTKEGKRAKEKRKKEKAEKRRRKKRH